MDIADLVRFIEEVAAERLRGRAPTPAESPRGRAPAVPVAVSSRHVHLCEADWRTLFGDEPLTQMRDLSQPGEFAAQETLTLVGPRGVLERVRVLGPLRRATQVELSRSDAIRVGLTPPVRDSGQLDGSPGVTLVGPAGAVHLQQGVILAWRHIHMTPEDAVRLGMKDKQLVGVRLGGDRSLVLGSVLVRVSPDYRLELHLDTDEANAGLLQDGDLVELVSEPSRAVAAPEASSPPWKPGDQNAPGGIGGKPGGTGTATGGTGTATGGTGSVVYDRRLLSAQDVLTLVRGGTTQLDLPPRTMVTALAADTAREKGLVLVRR